MQTIPVIVRRFLLFSLTLVLGCLCLPLSAGTPAPDPFIDSLVSAMSPEEKAGQMILVYNSPLDFLREHKVGGVLIMQNMLKKPSLLRRNLRRAQKKLPVPLLVAIDQEGGTVNRLSPMPGWETSPSAEELGGWEHDSIRSYTSRVGAKLRHLGINMNLAPVVDPAVNGVNGETYMGLKKRSFGTDSGRIVTAACAFVSGFADRNVLCVTKHFPGYDVATNSDLEASFSNADSLTIDRYAAVFSAIRPSPAGIMMTSIRYSLTNDTPAVLSSYMISLARKISGDNIIMTDDLWTVSLMRYILPDSTVTPAAFPDSAFQRLVSCAVRAGNDMLMITYPKKVPLMIRTIVELSRNDPLVRSQIDNSARRILTAKKKIGLIGK